MVFSGFRFVRHAHKKGIPVVAINQGITRADDLLNFKIDADCGEVLSQVVANLAVAGTDGKKTGILSI